MPKVELRGNADLRKALRTFTPDLQKALDKELRIALKPIVSAARGFVTSEPPMTNWRPRSFSEARFPAYNSSLIRSGIVASTTPSKRNPNGFTGMAKIQNKSAAGAIYEWAGRINPEGLPWVGPKGDPNNRKVSHSNWKGAGAQFVKVLDTRDGYRQIHGKKDGRLILRAVEKDQGRFRRNIISGVERAMVRCQERMNITDTFGGSNG